jgi:hypothetical protein
VNLDRPGFLVNPTNCADQAIAATIDSSQGASADLSTPFQVVGCAGLMFAPHLTASTQARASQQGDGASLDIDIANPAGTGASVRSVVVQIPSQLRPRLTTIQHACVAKQPISLTTCAPDSQIGEATVISPVTASPLTGPIYLISHGSGALPSLAMLLQSEEIEVELDGTLSISSKDVITTSFTRLPDVPISSLRLALPRGPHSILGAVASLCAKRLSLASVLVDQGGAKRKDTVRIAVSGCPRRASHAKQTRHH